MNLEEFNLYNRQNHKNLPTDASFRPVLPSPLEIYKKDFHFLDEPLINRKYPLMALLNSKSSQSSSSSVPKDPFSGTLQEPSYYSNAP